MALWIAEFLQGALFLKSGLISLMIHMLHNTDSDERKQCGVKKKPFLAVHLHR